MDLRNAFVHYKWKINNEQTAKELALILEGMEKTVKYIREFENKNLLLRQKRRIHGLFTKDPLMKKSISSAVKGANS